MIHFRDRRLQIDDQEYELDYPIHSASRLEDKVIVLFQPEAFEGAGQFANLIAIDSRGRELWKAELPTSLSMDAYYRFSAGDQLTADSFCSYRCTLDPADGTLLNKVFLK